MEINRNSNKVQESIVGDNKPLPSKSSNFSHVITDIPDQLINLIPILLKAYRTPEQRGHGDLILKNGAEIKGYVADMPDDYALEDHHVEGRRCKHINKGMVGLDAKVCVGFDNNIPEEGDIDFFLVDDKWHKIRSGTAIVSKDPSNGQHTIDAPGLLNVTHEVGKTPFPWSWQSQEKINTPANYLHRLSNEPEIGPLPSLPKIPEN